MIGMKTALEYQMGDDFPFGLPRVRYNVPKGNIPSDKQKCQPKSPTKEVLDKYNITEEEYYNICNELKDKLFVGGCRWRF